MKRGGMALPSLHRSTIPVAGFEAFVANMLQAWQPVIAQCQKKSTGMLPSREIFLEDSPGPD
jgi:hypothetical protein